MADGKICTAELTPSILNDNKSIKIDVSNLEKTAIPLSKGIHSSPNNPSRFVVEPGEKLSSTTKYLKVKDGGISIVDFVQEDTNQYSANIKIEFDSEDLVRPLKPISIRTSIFTTNDGTILGCGQGGAAFGGMFDNCSCRSWGRCKGNQLNDGKFSCPEGFTPYLISNFDDRGKCGHAIYVCYK